MSASQKEHRQPALAVGGAACRLRHISPIDRIRFALNRRAIIKDKKDSPEWRRSLRRVEEILPHPPVKAFLPAQGGAPRICRMAECLWAQEDLPQSAEGINVLIRQIAGDRTLTYDEIDLLPLAVRLCAAEHFMDDTALLRDGCEDGEALLRRFVQAGRLADAAQRIDAEKLLSEMNRAEQVLRQDPARVYPQMSAESKRRIRSILRRLAVRSGLSEEQTAQAALEMCRSGACSDVTQAFLTEDGLSRLQKKLQIPRHRRFGLHPDSGGSLIIGASIGTFALLSGLHWFFSGNILLTAASLPLVWRAARQIFERAAGCFVRPAPIPEMEIERIPRQLRTLAVIPARIGNRRELVQRMDELAALGALYDDENVEYLLLADFADCVYAHCPEDDELMAAAQAQLWEINAQALHGRGHVLWRERVWNPADGMFQPYERKRGALMALFALLSGEKSPFVPDAAADELRQKQFRFCITMDAGTQPLPRSLHRLIGMMAWPGNPYAVIQPEMRSAMRQRPSLFDRMFAQDGGISAYPAAGGNLYQDLTGRGIYCGKGIVDVRAFRLALENRLPENQILSHDLVEGAISGAGYASGVLWLEEQPTTLHGHLARFERWTRGDWQLLPLLLDRNQPLDRLARFQMADNLAQSLLFPSLFMSLAAAATAGSAFTAVAAAAVPALPMLLNPQGIREERLMRLLCDAGLIPIYACTALAAIARALYRTYVSRRHMLDWKTASTADREGSLPWKTSAAGILLLLPGLRFAELRSGFLAWMGLFAFVPLWLRLGMKTPPHKTLTEDQIQCLKQIACATWRYFERYANAENHHLPPDNVQDENADARTSPTNIGMYLASCLCAEKLGLIERGECEKRLSDALATLEKLPKQRGHLYNWYDVQTLLPMNPAVVSSVDSGNLACCLMLLSCADLSQGIRARAAEIAEAMDFSALYDGSRGLFRVTSQPSDGAKYDLYASESRLLSLAAIALGQIPPEHWQKLGRPAEEISGRRLYLSWSGTMFEYLMPDLFFTAPEGSAWHVSAQAAVKIQQAKALHGLWGVSESGCCERDAAGHYGYRAFGLREIGCAENAEGGVFAPYAAALALKYAPTEAADMLMRYYDCAYRDECGLWEAVDCRAGSPQPVRSHMAHHQGMILCAITNALREDFLPQTAMRNPKFRAIAPLLQERMS